MKYRNIILYVTLLIISVIYVVTFMVQPINSWYNQMVDDFLMVDLADNIVQGNWLGEYNRFTLVKGVFTPLFIAICYLIKMPFLIGLAIFYTLACILFISVIKKIIKSNFVLVLLFTSMLFNPVMYSSTLCRVYRESIYVSLTLYLLSFVIAIFLNRKEEFKKLIKYFIGFGLAYTGMYFCREETIWLLPFVILSSFTTIAFIVFDKSMIEKVKKVLLYLIPIGILVIAILTVCILNYKYYGVFMINQYWGKDFKEAYGALTRISINHKYKRVPITKETLKKAYEASPTFKELEKYLEDEEFREKRIFFHTSFVADEIDGASIHWAIMEAVDLAGYYKDARTANEFYRKVAEEINNAIDEGKLEGLPYKRISNTAIVDFSDIKNIIINMKDTIRYEYFLDDVRTRVFPYSNSVVKDKGAEERKAMFRKMTNSKPAKASTYVTKSSKLRLKVLENITRRI